ncbi:12633_t:CDS:1, partial [Dentiscutata heterogama]
MRRFAFLFTSPIPNSDAYEEYNSNVILSNLIPIRPCEHAELGQRQEKEFFKRLFSCG